MSACRDPAYRAQYPRVAFACRICCTGGAQLHLSRSRRAERSSGYQCHQGSHAGVSTGSLSQTLHSCDAIFVTPRFARRTQKEIFDGELSFPARKRAATFTACYFAAYRGIGLYPNYSVGRFAVWACERRRIRHEASVSAAAILVYVASTKGYVWARRTIGISNLQGC
jgi:hypothetical protein